MIGFHARLAWRSVRRTPGFTVVMLAALALGIAIWYTERRIVGTVAFVELAGRDDLRNVSLPRRSGPRGSVLVALREAAAALLSAPDARALLGTGATRRETATFGAPALLERPDGGLEEIRVRYATRDFFAMFEIPFARGGPWSAAADAGGLAGGPADAVVVDEALARRLFGDGPAVGRRLRLDGAERTVTGIVEAGYRRLPRLYDSRNTGRDPALLYLPLAAAAAARAQPDFVQARGGHGDAFADLLAGDDGWLQVWVELPDAAAGAAFRGRARHRLEAERAARRLGAAGELELRTPAAWHRDVFALEGSINIWPIVAWMAVLASALNLVRVLMAKFAGRAPELGLQRALGARRGALRLQLLFEAGLVGLMAGVAGVVVALAMMPVAVSSLTTSEPLPWLHAGDVVEAMLLSIGAAILAAAYPAWQLGRGSPASQLRRA